VTWGGKTLGQNGCAARDLNPEPADLAGFYLVLALISPSGMGMGDVKAAAGLGTMLAWRGWSALIAGGFAGFLLAAVYGTTLLISGRGTRKHQIPFGPFMIAGAFLVILVGTYVVGSNSPGIFSTAMAHGWHMCHRAENCDLQGWASRSGGRLFSRPPRRA
jgi:hypothetical protein